MNATGVGERRPIKTGDLGRVPPENVVGEVAASPNQDVFAFGVDLCFILTKPALRTKNDCLWIHWVRGVSVAAGGWSGREGGGVGVILTSADVI